MDLDVVVSFKYTYDRGSRDEPGGYEVEVVKVVEDGGPRNGGVVTLLPAEEEKVREELLDSLGAGDYDQGEEED